MDGGCCVRAACCCRVCVDEGSITITAFERMIEEQVGRQRSSRQLTALT